MTTARLFWTGHALIDVGVAGVCAFTKRKRPEDVTLEDLDAVSNFLVDTYYQEKLGTYLTCVFMNSSFVQRKEKLLTREEFIQHYLKAHRASPDPEVAGMRCAFSGLPATSPLVRTHLPMFSGEGVMNFRPDGSTFVPAAGSLIVALLFLPMSSRRAEGKLLCVQAEDSDLMLRFARRYLEDNARLISLALPSTRALTHEGYNRELPSWDTRKKTYKYADVKGPRSLVISDLTEIAAEATGFENSTSPLSVYLLSSSGKGPSLEVFDVPGGVVSFVLKAAGASTKSLWSAVAQRFRKVKDAGNGTEETRRKKGKSRKPSTEIPAGRPGWSKNPAFEDLCAIYEGGFLDRGRARTWLSRYVLGRIKPDTANSRLEDTNARTWALAELFLKEVFGMKRERINAVRQFGDKIAGWISEQRAGDGKKLLYSVLRERPSDLRRKLVRALARHPERTPFFSLDEFCLVWLEDDRDAWLVQDLLAIRVIERLHELGHYGDVAADMSIEIDPASDATIPELEEF